MTRSGSWSCASASAQRSVPLRHSGEVMMTPTPKPVHSIGDPLIVGDDEHAADTPATRRAASTLRWIRGFAAPLAPFSSTSGFPG